MVKVVYSYAPQLMSSKWVALLKGDRNDVDALRLVKNELNDWREKILCAGRFVARYGETIFEARSRVTPYLG
jgi:hypothetical protein